MSGGMENIKLPSVDSTWVVGRALGYKDPMIWTVKGASPAGVYVTCPESRSPGHLLPVAFFRSEYVPVRKAAA